MRRLVARIDARFPAWMVSTAAGTLAIMLVILLFFIRDPGIAAEPSNVDGQNSGGNLSQSSALDNPSSGRVQPQPTLTELADRQALANAFERNPEEQNAPSSTLDLQPSAPITPLPMPKLQYELVRTRLPLSWDQDELVTVSSQPEPLPAGWRMLARSSPDPWKIAVPCRERAKEFSPYLPRGASLPVEPTAVAASDRPETSLPSPADANVGLELEKFVPGSADEGAAFTYDIYVRNPTSGAIDAVVVRERISVLERVAAVSPVAAVHGDELVWSLGALPAHDVRKLSVTLLADSETAVETGATITAKLRIGGRTTQVQPAKAARPSVFEFEEVPRDVPRLRKDGTDRAEATPRPAPLDSALSEVAVPNKPVLNLTSSPVTSVHLGETFAVVFTVTNTGTAAADGVTLYAELSKELRHRHGRVIEHAIPRLDPGSSHRAVLRAVACEARDASVTASLTMNGDEQLQEVKTVKIVSVIPLHESP